MEIDISSEVHFRTARSEGKGGQNVNKVETMVEGRWHLLSSSLVNTEQKKQIAGKTTNRITKDGFLLIKSQTERTQLGNKTIVLKKMNQLVNWALISKKPRIVTLPTKNAKIKRMENKKFKSKLKQSRQKWSE